MWDGATVAMLEALVVLCVLLDGKSSCSWFLSSRTDNSTRDQCCVASLPLNPVIDIMVMLSCAKLSQALFPKAVRQVWDGKPNNAFSSSKEVNLS